MQHEQADHAKLTEGEQPQSAAVRLAVARRAVLFAQRPNVNASPEQLATLRALMQQSLDEGLYAEGLAMPVADTPPSSQPSEQLQPPLPPEPEQ